MSCMHLCRRLLGAVFLSFGVYAHAETILNGNPVFDLAQTPEGITYLATAQGLGRYAGDLLIVQESLIKQGMKSREISALSVHPDGDVYVGTIPDGLYRLNKMLKIKQQWLADTPIYSVHVLNEDNVLVGTDKKLYRVNLRTNEIDDLATGKFFWRIVQTDTHIIAAGESGLWVSPLNSFDFKQVLDEEVWDIAITPHGFIAFTNPYTYLYAPDLTKVRLDSKSDPAFAQGVYDPTRDMLVVVTADNVLEHRSLPEFKKIETLPSTAYPPINRVIIDQFGTLLVATIRGLSARESFLTPDDNATRQLRGGKVFVTPANDGQLLLCDWNSIYQYRVGESATPFNVADSLLAGNQIFACKVSNGSLWVGSSKGLIEIDLAKNTAEFFHLSDGRKITDTVLAIHEDPNNGDTLAIGTKNSGILIVNIKEKRIESNIGKGEHIAFARDAEDNSYFIQRNTLLSQSPDGTVNVSLEIKELLSKSFAITLNGGYAWVASYGEGVFKVNLATGRVERFTMAHGLPSNLVNGLIVDKKNTLFVSTRLGLAFKHVSSERFTPFGDANFFSVGTLQQLSDTQFLAAGPDGISYWNPQDIENLAATPATLGISSITTREGIEFGPTRITLDHDSEVINIAPYVSNLLTLARGTMIEVMFPGHSKGWSSVAHNSIGLPPGVVGNFTMLLRSALNPNYIIEIPVTISGPWSQNAFLYLVLSIALAAAGAVLMLFSMQRKEDLLTILRQWLVHFQVASANSKIATTNYLRSDLAKNNRDMRKLIEQVSNDTDSRLGEISRMRINQAAKKLQTTLATLEMISDIHLPNELRYQSLGAAIAKVIPLDNACRSVLNQMDNPGLKGYAAPSTNVSNNPKKIPNDKLSLVERKILFDLIRYDVVGACREKWISLDIGFGQTDDKTIVILACETFQLARFITSELYPKLSGLNCAIEVKSDAISILVAPTVELSDARQMNALVPQAVPA